MNDLEIDGIYISRDRADSGVIFQLVGVHEFQAYSSEQQLRVVGRVLYYTKKASYGIRHNSKIHFDRYELMEPQALIKETLL